MHILPSFAEIKEAATAALAKEGIGIPVKQGQENYCPSNRIPDYTKRFRIRFFGHDPSGMSIDPATDTALLQGLEDPFVQWADDFRAAVAEARADPSSRNFKDGLTPRMSQVMTEFQENGGLSSRSSPELIKHLHRAGLISLIELEVRNGIFVVIGAVASVPRPWAGEGGYAGPLAKFDVRKVVLGRQERQWGSLKDTVAQNSLLVAKSIVLPTTDAPFIEEQLKAQGTTLPDDLRGKDLQRCGYPSIAKSRHYAIAEEMGSTFATAFVGGLTCRDNLKVYRNHKGYWFNKWMDPFGEMGDPMFEFDPDDDSVSSEYSPANPQPSLSCLTFNALVATLEEGREALVGQQGTATRKGHDIAAIQKKTEKWIDVFTRSIRDGSHEPW